MVLSKIDQVRAYLETSRYFLVILPPLNSGSIQRILADSWHSRMLPTVAIPAAPPPTTTASNIARGLAMSISSREVVFSISICNGGYPLRRDFLVPLRSLQDASGAGFSSSPLYCWVLSFIPLRYGGGSILCPHENLLQVLSPNMCDAAVFPQNGDVAVILNGQHTESCIDGDLFFCRFLLFGLRPETAF